MHFVPNCGVCYLVLLIDNWCQWITCVVRNEEENVKYDWKKGDFFIIFCRYLEQLCSLVDKFVGRTPQLKLKNEEHKLCDQLGGISFS